MAYDVLNLALGIKKDVALKTINYYMELVWPTNVASWMKTKRRHKQIVHSIHDIVSNQEKVLFPLS